MSLKLKLHRVQPMQICFEDKHVDSKHVSSNKKS